MKKIAAFLMGMCLVSFVSAQEGEEPLPEDYEIAVESEEMARKGMDATLVAADEKLDSRIKKLESALKIGGYLGATFTWNTDSATTAFTDSTPENTRFRFNFSFTDAIFVMKARAQFRPLKNNLKASDLTDPAKIEGAVEGITDYLQLVYYDVTAKLFDGYVNLYGGKNRVTDFATFFYGMRDNAGAGYIDEAPGFGTTFNLSKALPAGNVLKFGLFVPVKDIYGTDQWANSGEEIDVQIAYEMGKNLLLRAGFLGGDFIGKLDNDNGATMDFFTPQSLNGFNSMYLSLATDLFGVVPGLNLVVVPSYTYSRVDSVKSSYLGVNGSVGFKSGDFYAGLDVGFKSATEDKKNPDMMLYTFLTLDYTLQNALGNGVHLVPELEFKAVYNPNYAKNAFDFVYTISPELNIRAGKSEFRFGADISMSGSGADKAYLDTTNSDQSTLNVTVGYLLNF